MGEAEDLRAKIRAFGYDPVNERSGVTVENASSGRITKKVPQRSQSKSPKKRTVKKRLDRQGQDEVLESTQTYPDLPPCITTDQQVLFIGYNPGLQSSIQQHHYAHFSNSFWKLFNQSKLFLKVLERIPTEPLDPFLERVTDYKETWLRPEHDASLINYKVGFTDLVLRCTKTAQELTLEEKLENVPRLLDEFNYTKSRFLVFIGKGIWEVVIKYLARSIGVAPPKLDLATFEWGRQSPDQIRATENSSKSRQTIRQLLEHFYALVPKGVAVYVFPSTSGLVTTMNFAQKLELWADLAAQV